MKKAITIINLLLGFILAVNGQTPAYQWTNVAGGTYSDYGRSVITDINGDVIVGGDNYHNINLGGTILSGWGDPFVAKLDANGNYQWAVGMGGDMNDLFGDICTDPSGNIYATGMFQGPATFGTTTLTGSGSFDTFIVKLDTDGNFIWVKEVNATGGITGCSITADASGNLFVTGDFSGTATFDANTISSGAKSVFVAKMDNSGNFIWATQASSTNLIYSTSIAVGPSGNIFITGHFRNTATFDTQSFTSAGDYDVFFSKLDASGNFVWTNAAGNTSRDWGNDIATDVSGNVYATGYFEREVTFGTITVSSVPLWKADGFITKINTNGDFQWVRQISGDSYEKGFSIATDASGNVYNSGQFIGSVNLGTITLTGSTTTVMGLVTKLNTNGDFEWAQKLGVAPGSDMAEAVAVDIPGNIYVAGTFEGDCAFGSSTYSSIGSQDFFVTQLAVPTITTNWTGALDSDWNNAANWDNGVPGTSSITIIPDVGSISGNFPQINGDATCKELQVNSYAMLTIASSGTLTVLNSTLNNGSMMLMSDGTGVASFIDNGLTNNGNFYIERYSAIPGWHLAGSPLSNATANSFLGTYLQSYDEPTGVWTDITDETQLLNPMQGYGLWTINTGDIYTFSGNPNTGSMNTSFTANNAYGWNLLSNPYPSGMDWDMVNKPAEINNAIYYLDAATGNYVSYNAGIGAGSQYIPPMQGFWVSANAAGSIQFDNSVRTHAGTDNFYKSVNEPANQIVLKAAGNGLYDKTYIQINQSATAAFDGSYDAYKLLSTNPELPQIYSIANEDLLSINCLPQTTNVGIGFSALQSGIFTISLNETNGFETIILEDRLMSSFTNLKEEDYSFSYDQGSEAGRFTLHFMPLSISESNNLHDVNIYSYGSSVYYKSPILLKSGIIQIYNVTGSLIASKEINHSDFGKVTLNDASGFFVITILADGSSYSNKVFLK